MLNETIKPAEIIVPHKSLAFGVACICFLALGMLTAALGPALADLAQNTGVPLAGVGGIFTALFLGSLISQALAGQAQDRFGPRPVLLFGLVVVGAGTLALSVAPSLPMLLLLTLVAGVGHGATDVATNVMASELYPQRRAAALNLVNVFFGVGAFIGPAFAGLTLRLYDTALPALWLGGGLMLLLLPAMWAWAPRQMAATHDPADTTPAAQRVALVLRSPALWTFALLILSYVGIENAIGGWTPTYLERSAGVAASQAALITSSFWLSLTVGRIAATLLGTRLSSPALLGVSLGTALLGSLIMAFSGGSVNTTTVGIILLGMGYGPIFPTTLAMVTATFRGAAGTAAGAVVALGALGGMIIPPLQGWLLEQVSPFASQVLTVAMALSMIMFFIVALIYLRRHHLALSIKNEA